MGALLVTCGVQLLELVAAALALFGVLRYLRANPLQVQRLMASVMHRLMG